MQNDLSARLGALRHALETLRIPLAESEYQLHELIAAALHDGGFVVRHEAPLAPRCRVDFLVDGVGIEVKRGKPDRLRLLEQCRRYLSQDALEALVIVVDTRVSLPDTICGKPVVVIGLNRLWGIALP
ncbi:MAG: hypothetical protein IKS52_06745 [Clostridia bacterium]|nr:hypothetical protein [Clostridia bacterium]MBR4442950.1 hypothetical protein [Clostridia bacterium]